MNKYKSKLLNKKIEMNEKKNLTIKETFAVAFQNHQKNNFQVAEKLYKEILKKSPNHFQSNFLLGTLSAQTKKFDIAKQLLQTAIQINPNYAEAHNNLGNVLKELREVQKAKSCYEKAIEIKPNFENAHYNLGVVLKEFGENQKAKSCYEKAIQINSNYADAHNNLGVVLRALGENQKAISCYKKVIQIKPNFADAYCNLAILYMNINKHEEALQYCDQVLNLVPDMLKAINIKSEILKKNAPYWHAPMINDNDRNNFYFSALKSVIKTDSSVFEIGTGSGLLSIMAANLGAHEINTCEANSIIANAAIEVIADNNLSEKINVIPKKSNDIKVGEDINKQADVLVSEIFSSELLGENVLPSLEDAKQRLISKKAKIIPEYGSIMISLFGGDNIGKNIYTEKFENIKLKKFNPIIPKKHFLHRPDLKVNLMSNVTEAFRFDFVNKNNFPSENKKIEVEAIKKGRSYGIIQWIKLEMDNGLKYENHPAHLTKTSSWHNVFYLFDNPIELSIGQKVVITAKHDRNIVWFF